MWLAASPTLVEGSGVSFATDMLHSYADVKRKVETSAKVCDEFLSMVAARAKAEEAYAKSLRKLASNFSPSTTPGSTLHEATEAMKSDLLNKAVQHEVFQEALAAEVCEPILQVRERQSAVARAEQQKLARIVRQLKTQEEKYRTLSMKYERAWATACDRCGDARAAGISLVDAAEAATLSGSRSGPNASSKASKVARSTGDGAMGSALTQWLLPTEQERKGHLLALAMDSVAAAEEARKSALEAWEVFVGTQQRGVWGLQHALAQHQLLEERYCDTLRDGLRTLVVHESSALANSQYDLQMFMPCLDAVENDRDIAQFVAAVRESIGASQAYSSTLGKQDVVSGEPATHSEGNDIPENGLEEEALHRTCGGNLVNVMLLLGREGATGGALSPLIENTNRKSPLVAISPPSQSPIRATMTLATKDNSAIDGSAVSGAPMTPSDAGDDSKSSAPNSNKIPLAANLPVESDSSKIRHWNIPVLAARPTSLLSSADQNDSDDGQQPRVVSAESVLARLGLMGNENPVLSAALRRRRSFEHQTNNDSNDDDDDDHDHDEHDRDREDAKDINTDKDPNKRKEPRESKKQETCSDQKTLHDGESDHVAKADELKGEKSSAPTSNKTSRSRMFQRASVVRQSMSSSILKGIRAQSISVASLSSSSSALSPSVPQIYSSLPMMLLRERIITLSEGKTEDEEVQEQQLVAQRQLAGRFSCCLYHRVAASVCGTSSFEDAVTSSDRAAQAEAEVTQALVFLIEGRTSLEPNQLNLVLNHCSNVDGCNVLCRTLFGLCCKRAGDDAASDISGSDLIGGSSSHTPVTSSRGSDANPPLMLPAETLHQLGQLMRRALDGAVNRLQSSFASTSSWSSSSTTVLSSSALYSKKSKKKPMGATGTLASQSAQISYSEQQSRLDRNVPRDLLVIAFNLSTLAVEYAAMLVSTFGPSVLHDTEYSDLFSSLQGFGGSTLDADAGEFDSDDTDDSDVDEDEGDDENEDEGKESDGDIQLEEDEATRTAEKDYFDENEDERNAVSKNLHLQRKSVQLPIQPWSMKPEAAESERRQLAAERRRKILERRQRKQEEDTSKETVSSTTLKGEGNIGRESNGNNDAASLINRGNGGLVFAHRLLQSHTIWRDKSLWDTIICDSCGGDLSDAFPPPSLQAIRIEYQTKRGIADETMEGIYPAIEATSTGPLDVLIAQVVFVAHAMRSSGLDRAKVQSYLKRRVARLKLSSRDLDEILSGVFL